MSTTTKEESSAMSTRDSSTTESGTGATASAPAPADVHTGAHREDVEIDMPDMAEWTERVLEAMPADGSPISPFALAIDIGEPSPNGLWLVNECLDDLTTAAEVHREPNELFWRREVAA